MKPISNVKEHIFLIIDLINMLQRESRLDDSKDGIDVSIGEKLIKRLDNGNNQKLVGENALVKDNLINYVTKMMTNIDSRPLSNSSVTMEVTELLSEGYDTDLIKKSFLDGDDKKKVSELRYNIIDYVNRADMKATMKEGIYNIDNNTSLKLNEILERAIGKLESLYSTETTSEHVSMEITSDDVSDEKLDELGKKADEAINKKVYRLGFQDLNRMLQGGLRAGQFTTVGARPSNFKTGMNIRFFQDIAILNKPTIWEDGKKSALVWFSFEDPLGTTILQMYQSIYMDEHGVHPNIKNIDTKEIFRVVLEKLKANGWHVIFKKIDANDWTYRGLFKEIEDIEKDGYRIEALTLDYLPHMSTAGCTNNNGAAGTPLRELVRRVAHHCANKDILLMSPLQLSTGAKKLLENGVEDYEFVKRLPNMGLYADSGQLDQEIFLEIFTHIAKVDGRAFLTIQRGKHKIPSLIDEEDKYVILPLPKRGYLKSDLNDDKPCGFRTIEAATGNSKGSGGIFDF